MQPYRSDVLTKGPHADILSKGNKITEALLDVIDDKLTWKRFGDMGSASKKVLKQAQKTIDDLASNKKIMNEAKDQVKKGIDEMSDMLKNGTKKQVDFAKRNIPKFEKMLKLF